MTEKQTGWVFRGVAAILGAAVAWLVLEPILNFLQASLGYSLSPRWDLVGVVALGGLVGLWLGPRPVRSGHQAATAWPGEQVVYATLGLLLGLAASALAAVPLGMLPDPVGQIAPLLATLTLCYWGVVSLGQRSHDLELLWQRLHPPPAPPADSPIPELYREVEPRILLDTSVIIDGRITDVAKTGFIKARVLVPHFVLTELQHIADSPDPIRRKRGRRGLDILNILRSECPVPIEITDMDVSEAREVDAKLVALARELNCPIMTNDYNLNRVAGLQGVQVLNINDLANAVKAAYLPGEDLVVKVIQEGREVGQGVGYLDDGTMVVIEDGRDKLGQNLDVVVTKVLQTSAGRMIFARILNL